ncbi:MAG: lepB, partial [Alphaproteobacteria bacterium]|nr:lepB [Alphaproteobacteria bacterium]
IDYIKRLVGLPGDTIQMKAGRLYINHNMVNRIFLGEYEAFSVPDNKNVTYKRYREELPGGHDHDIIEESDKGPLDSTDIYHVPADHYFMMGDNRDGSQDSRVMEEVGFVPTENLVGRAENIFFSLDEKAQIWEVWKWPEFARFKRFLKKIV